MDVVPKPDQVVAAAGNVAHAVVRGGVADRRPMPRTLIDEGDLRRVFRYRPAEDAPVAADPVLLVSPLAAPSSCFDLRRGCSLVQHLVAGGRPTYLVEYGEVSLRDRGLGLGPFVADVVPAAIREVSRHAGDRPVHVVGWSLGGIFALLAAAGSPDLPIASLAVLGAPVDVTQVPLMAPLRPLIDPTQGPGLVGRLTRLTRAASPLPAPLLHWTVQLGAFQRLVTKPLAIAANLDDADFLAQVEAVGRLQSEMTAYPGRSFGQLYHRFAHGNALASGTVHLGDSDGGGEGGGGDSDSDGEGDVSLAAVAPPVLVVAGATDGIAPVAAVKAVVPLLTGAREARFEIVPGGHLGLLTGRAARESTWPVLDDWFEEWSGPPRAAAPIGANRRRRYGSTGSRSLSR